MVDFSKYQKKNKGGIMSKENPNIKKGFYDMKETLGQSKYDILNIVTGTLFHDAVLFMNRLGVLEEFLEDKNEFSHNLVNSFLELKIDRKDDCYAI